MNPMHLNAAQLKALAPQFARFVVVGGTCFGVGLATVYALTDLVGLHYLMSMTLSLPLVSLTGWLLNRKWTFESRQPKVAAEASRYIAVNLLGFGMTLALMALLVSGLGLHYIPASVLAAAIMTLVNFMAHRRWSFGQKSAMSKRGQTL